MALVTVQRSPSPSNSPEAQLGSDVLDGESGIKSPHKSQRVSSGALKTFHKLYNTIRFVSRIRFSETYLAVKGAACILPQSECLRTITKGSHGGDMQTHLQSMFYLLRSQDTIKVAVKVESMYPTHNRYLVVVSTIDRQDTEESVILGVDIMDDQATIGLVLTIWGDMTIRLDGDGGFSLASNERHHIFKPVSVQAMWSALQSLIRVRNIAQRNNYYPKGLTHTWVTYYEVRVKSEQSCINEWNAMEDIESHRSETPVAAGSLEKAQVEKAIKSKLKAIMMAVDLEEVTSVYLRSRLEETMGMSLTEYKPFIDEEMIVIMRQMDAASEIFDYLYLGSEWNASNLEELQEQGIGNILNMAREIDNFFPGVIGYYNVRVYDVEQAELLRHWDNTFKFINRVKQQHQKVLVHCKMGVSRSACTVMAYAMKEYGWTLEQAYQFVKQKRSCIKPNAGFMKQLIIYQGILDASKQRHNKLWRSVSVGNLNEMTRRRESSEESSEDEKQNDEFLDLSRPRSWTPHNCELHCRKNRHTDKDDTSSSDGRQATGANAVHSPPAERSGTCGASSTTGEVALFTLDEDSTNTDQNASPKPCTNTSNNQPVVDTAAWCVAPHGAVSSVRKVEEWMAKTPLEGIVESSAAAMENAIVDSSVESPTLSRANVRHEKTKVHSGTDEGCVESLAPPHNHMVHSASAAALLTSKVRPDNSWIKDALPTPSDGATVDDAVPNSVVEVDKPEVVDNTADLTNQKPDAVSEDGSLSEKSDGGAELKEIGVVAHYEKELIPWNTGTVRRQTQDLEERLKSGLKLCSDASSPVSSIGSPVSTHNDFSSVAASNTPLTDVGDDPAAMSPERSSPSTDALAKKAVSSIYANEDIPLEPGIVMRTKHEIEERSKKSRDVDESRPVQRSSSWKVGQAERSHKRHNRNSDRRKTCLPVLQFSSFVDNSDSAYDSQRRRCSAGEERKTTKEPATENSCEVKVYQIGSEQVEMQKDKVKRRTKDFEELSKEEQDERACPALIPTTQELKRSHSPFPSNDEFEIRTGSVLEQKLTIEMKYGTAIETTHHVTKPKHPDDAAKTNVDAHDHVDADAPTLDANLNVEMTSDVPACNACSSRLIAGGVSDRAGGQTSVDFGDKCGDAGCKYCSRVLDAYYGVAAGTTGEWPRKVAGPSCDEVKAPVGGFSPPRLHRLAEGDDVNSTKPAKANVGDGENALLYSSNYSLPGVPRKTVTSHPSCGSYPTQDIGHDTCDHNAPDEFIHSLKHSDIQNGPRTLDTPCSGSDVRPVTVYEEEDITSRVRTTWHETASLSPTPTHKMDARTLTLIRHVASTFQCSPVRSRGIVRRIARDIESGASLQESCVETPPELPKSAPPELPKSTPPELPKSLPPGACLNSNARAECESYASCHVTAEESPATCASSHSFTSTRALQLNTKEATHPVDSTEPPESVVVGRETSPHESSPPPTTDDSRVRNLVEIFEPKDVGASAAIVKRLTWHAGDRTKPTLASPSDDTRSATESPPGPRRPLPPEVSVGTNASDQAQRHADGGGDSKFVSKLVELCTVPEVTLSQQQQQDQSGVPTRSTPTPAGDQRSCQVTDPRRPWERRIPINTQREPDPSQVPRKTRKLQGKSHPLSRLSGDASQLGRSVNPFYNTM